MADACWTSGIIEAPLGQSSDKLMIRPEINPVHQSDSDAGDDEDGADEDQDDGDVFPC
jgi:hypothetical protein